MSGWFALVYIGAMYGLILVVAKVVDVLLKGKDK